MEVVGGEGAQEEAAGGDRVVGFEHGRSVEGRSGGVRGVFAGGGEQGVQVVGGALLDEVFEPEGGQGGVEEAGAGVGGGQVEGVGEGVDAAVGPAAGVVLEGGVAAGVDVQLPEAELAVAVGGGDLVGEVGGEVGVAGPVAEGGEFGVDELGEGFGEEVVA
jgi:hypothetical protein